MNTQAFYFFYNLTRKFPEFNWFFVFNASYLFYILILIFIIHLLLNQRLASNKKRAWLALAFISAGFARGILTEIIRYFYHNQRPFVFYDSIKPLIPESSYSFPSGHTIFIFSFATIVYFYNKKLAYWLSFGGLIMGLARVTVGVHWPSDILGGIVLGILTSVILYKIAAKKFLNS
ncbi:MAG TPA: phosphatase PAP2 family protein [Candidatus Paceibacterota bacterium]